ncbi:MAG TPA: hypothetical protein VJ981_05240, partial [Gammaproteobacteria bacterium]|nr:hypothetical protein [Gammaproteobacteria bacterium]
ASRVAVPKVRRQGAGDRSLSPGLMQAAGFGRKIRRDGGVCSASPRSLTRSWSCIRHCRERAEF